MVENFPYGFHWSEVPLSSKKEIVFARPVYSAELLTEENRKKFDGLPAWQRHLVKRVIEHGDLERAAQEAGVATYVKKSVDPERIKQVTIREALEKGGLTSEAMVAHIQDCLDAEVIRLDKHGNPIKTKDMKLKLETLKFVAELRGDFEKNKETDKPARGTEELFDDTPV
jgi:hypothetical protein